MTTTRSAWRRTTTTAVHRRVQLHSIFVVGVCIVSLFQFHGLVRYYYGGRHVLLQLEDHGSSTARILLASSSSSLNVLDHRRNASRRRTGVISSAAANYSNSMPREHSPSTAARSSTFDSTSTADDDDDDTAAADNESSSHDGWGIYRLTLNDNNGGDDAPPRLRAAERTTSRRKVPDEMMILPPQTVFLDYMRRHSADALRDDTPEEFYDRKFVIAYYSCPHQLGNRLFHFMNNVLWAIVTDRTVLYKYLDKDTCEHLKVAQPMLYLDDTICQAANTVADCDAVLERTPWLPSYDEFADLAWEIHRVDFWQTHVFRTNARWIKGRYLFDESKHTNMAQVDRIDAKLVEFSALTNVETTDLTSYYTRQGLLATPRARTTAQQLCQMGQRFVYGMFFTEMFRLRNQEANLVKDYYPKQQRANDSSNVFSIALHSRHKQVRQTGEYIQNEKDCLNVVLGNRLANQPCQVCAMSDRPMTLEKLKVWLEQEHNCSLIHVNHSISTTSFSEEHGPNAGASFARELDVCHRYGSHAVVTTSGASSSALLEALVDYNNNNHFYNGRVHRGRKNIEAQFCDRTK
jgi:hypothetical protein